MKKRVILICGLLAAVAGGHLSAGSVRAEGVAVKDVAELRSTDDEVAERIGKILVSRDLKNDLAFIGKSDRKFQFHQIDLNGDGDKEIFVRFLTAYFCGTGGCTFLLLDKEGNRLTRFSVTRAPIYAEKKKVNGWAILLVKDRGVFKELKYENGTYPANPSVVAKAPRDAPSDQAEVIFYEDFSKAKTYSF